MRGTETCVMVNDGDHSMKPDKLVILKTREGCPVEIAEADRKFATNHADATSLTSELRNRLPEPAHPAAQALMLVMREAHRQGDGFSVVELAEEFRARFGWYGRAEWFRLLGLELTHAPELIEEQQRFIETLRAALLGILPEGLTELEADMTPDHIRWMLGANAYNLAEWLTASGRTEEALEALTLAFQGLEGPEFPRRVIERYLLQACLLLQLDRSAEAAHALDAARSVDARLFETIAAERVLERPDLRPLLSHEAR